MANDPDIFLIDRLRNGDPEALRILFDQYFPLLMRKAYGITGNKEVSEELLQDVFIYLWNSRQQLSIQTSTKAYLLQAIRNRCYTYFSREFRNDHLSIDESNFAVHTDMTTDREIHAADLQKVISSSISKLPEKTRVIFLMSRNEEMSYKDISQNLNISVKTVEYHMGNALRLLREFIKHYGYLTLFFLTSQ